MRFEFEFAPAWSDPGPVGVKHGPQSWPWWLLISLKVYRLGQPYTPMSGLRLWIYTRWGATFADLHIRHPRQGMVCGECRKPMNYDSNAWRCECGVTVFPVELKDRGVAA